MEKQKKFDFETMSNDEDFCVCFNKEKYTKEQAFELGKKEIEKDFKCDDIEVTSGYVRFGTNKTADGVELDCWHLTSYFDKHEDDIEVWVVQGFEQ